MPMRSPSDLACRRAVSASRCMRANSAPFPSQAAMPTDTLNGAPATSMPSSDKAVRMRSAIFTAPRGVAARRVDHEIVSEAAAKIVLA